MAAATTEANIPERLLSILAERSQFDTSSLAAELNLDHNKLIGAVKSLLSHEGVS